MNADELLEDLARELERQPTLTAAQVQVWAQNCTTQQLREFLRRRRALSPEERARCRFIYDPPAWRLEVVGRVILSSDEEVSAEPR